MGIKRYLKPGRSRDKRKPESRHNDSHQQHDDRESRPNTARGPSHQETGELSSQKSPASPSLENPISQESCEDNFDERINQPRTATQWDEGDVHQQPESRFVSRGTNTEECHARSEGGQTRQAPLPLRSDESSTPGGSEIPVRRKAVETRTNDQEFQPLIETHRMEELQTAIWQRIKTSYPQLNVDPQSRLASFTNIVIQASFQVLSDGTRKPAAAESDLSCLKTKAEEWSRERTLLREKTEKLEMALGDCSQQVQDVREWYKMKLEQADWKHQQALSRLKEEGVMREKRLIQKQSEHVEDLVQRHQGELGQEREDHRQQVDMRDRELAKLKRAHADDKAKLKKQYEDETNELNYQLIAAENDYHAQTEQLNEDHALAVENLKDDFGKQETRYQEEMELLKQTHGTSEMQLIRKYEAALSQSSQKQQAREAQLAADHAQKTKSLMEELHELNAALLARDDEAYITPLLSVADLKREPDEHIKAQFLDLVQSVDDLGRLVWKEAPKTWTDQVLRDLGPNQNQRLLKKRILQDSIWTILHKHVYCSPFRVFGKEGQILERQWNEQCGQDPHLDNGLYTWPKPGVETERWRYFTIKECRKALINPIPSEWDPRARLKKGFKNNMDAVISELKSTLEEIVEWDSTDVQTVERLVKRLSNVWLEFGMHRCRIVIFLKGAKSKSAAEKVRDAREGALDLAVVPGLGRYGNVHGVGLDSFTIVGGCAGENVKLPWCSSI